MSFLAPLWLALAGAVAVPLLLHLMRRRLGTRVEFPAARYLLRAEKEHSRQLRLRNLLLMLLRVLAVLFVAMAAARPATQWFGGGHRPTALAIVHDNSLSTGIVLDGRPLLQDLKDAALDALRAANPDDRLWLLTADGTIRSGTSAALSDAVRRVGAFNGAGDLRATVSRAASTASAAGMEGAQVAVLTDAQRTSWESAIPLGDVEVLLYVPRAPVPPNRSVVAAEARPTRWTPRGTIAARITGADSVTYRITIGERTLARGTAAPGEEIRVRAAPAERGWLAGAVEIEPDELRADDRRHFALWIGATPTVALSSGAGSFVRSATDVLIGAGRLAGGAGVGVLAADELSTSAQLPALLLAPANPVQIGAANRALARAGVPWRFGRQHRDQSIARFASGGPIDTATVMLRHALIAEQTAISDTLASVNGQPWIVSGPRYVIIASPLIPEATSLPLRAAFVPWFVETISERLAGVPGQRLDARPGQPLARPPWADALEESTTGARTVLPDERFTAPAAPGVHYFTRAGRRVGALVVNPPTSEFILERLSSSAMTSRFDARRVRVAHDRGRWRELPFRAVPSRSLVPTLLALALGVLLVEAIAVRRASPSAA